MHEDHEDEVVNRNKIWSGTCKSTSALVHYHYVNHFM